MGIENVVKRLTPRHRPFAQGESMVAPVGFGIVGILLAVIGASAWWVLRTQRASVHATRLDQAHTVCNLLSQSAEVMMAREELSSLRRLVAEAGREYKLTQCRIVLPSGQVVADVHPSGITFKKLPPSWSKVAQDVPAGSSNDHIISLNYPLDVPGRGAARLELTAPVTYPSWSQWEGPAGVGAVGAAALAGLLLVYRRTRSRLQGMGAIREALISLDKGEAVPGALAVSAHFGPEAGAWNALLSEKEELRKQIVTDRARESVGYKNETHRDLAAACDALSHGLMIIDQKGRATYLNGAAATFLQVDRADALGKDVVDFIQEQEVVDAIRAGFSGSGFRRTSVEVDRGGGTSGVLRFVIRPARGTDSVAAVIIIEDITQQRVAESSRNTFVAQATHELRTPLTNILLYVETALEQGDSDPALRDKCLNVINQEGRRLERTVGDILSVAEIEAGSYQINKDDVRMDEMLEQLKFDYEAHAKEKQIKLTFDLPPKLPVLQGDRDKILLALHNLIGNALKYTAADGQVTVSAETAGNRLVVEVIDTGIGISEEELAPVFERFYRASDPRVAETPGSGMGLALAREVVRLHGGDVTVRSEFDKGSTFTLTLPLPAEAARDEDPRTATRSGHRSEG